MAASNASSRAASTERSSTPTLSNPNAAVDSTPNDSSKLKAFLSILKKFIGVTDMAAQRFSLPAQLMEPVPNLEYWHYLDRPEAFASIGDSDNELGRMLGALRFWFTKDLKYVKGKPCKPYNSTLGEVFRCNWDVDSTPPPVHGQAPASQKPSRPVRVTYLTEQTSHHPPVSAYYIDCPEKGVSGRGFDQISANFTGTRIRVSPGVYNHGIYIHLQNNDETYHLTHPTAHLGGILKGSLTVAVSDFCTVTCAKTRLKTLLVYQEEGWLGKAQNRVSGVIYKCDPENDNKTRIKDVPDADIIARLDGCWHDQIYVTIGNGPVEKSEKKLVIDLSPMMPLPKLIPPVDNQLPNESRMIWAPVTDAILAKDFTQATNAKQEIEERQRQKAADRKARNVEWTPRFFKNALEPPGRPELSEDGVDAIKRMHVDDYSLRPNVEMGA